MAEILVIGGHPDYKASHANRAILDNLHREMPHAEIIYLDALYPDFKINVKKEQDRLLNGVKTLVLDYPFWWFGYPSLLHRYIEEVFTHGFAYGATGNALKGINCILSFTTGAAESEYASKGAEGFPMDALMPPVLAMISFTGMKYKGSVISYNMLVLDPDDHATLEQIAKKAEEHCTKLIQLIQA